METYYWTTEQAHANNTETMSEYLDEINMLDLIMVDGSYAEGKNSKSETYAMRASGDGDFNKHKVEFELL